MLVDGHGPDFGLQREVVSSRVLVYEIERMCLRFSSAMITVMTT